VSGIDLLETNQREGAGAKNQLHYLRRTRAGKLSTAVLESIAQTDGSVLLDRDSRNEEIGEGGRTAAAVGASQFGDVLMVSEGGQFSFYQKGHCIWTL